MAVTKEIAEREMAKDILTNTPRVGESKEQAEARLARDPSRGVLNERGSTHGPYDIEASSAIECVERMMTTPNWHKLPLYVKHSLFMQEVKKARILHGAWDYFDHWRDISGYARLVEERCPKPEKK